MRRKILFIALCCLFAGQYVSAQKVFVKGNMTDISMVTPQTELFLKSKPQIRNRPHKMTQRSKR